MIKQLILNCFLINKGGRGQIKQKKKTVPQKVTIAKIPRIKEKKKKRAAGRKVRTSHFSIMTPKLEAQYFP